MLTVPSEGGAFGFSAAVSAGFSSSETSALSKQSTAESSVMNITYNVSSHAIIYTPRPHLIWYT